MDASVTASRTDRVIFDLDRQRYALDLARVERVVPRPWLEPFPKAPGIVAGVFVLHGQLVPVLDVRARFRLPAREPRLSDQLLVVRTRRRRVALAVDRVETVTSVPAETLVSPESVVPGLEYLRGVARLSDGLVFVHDLDTFLSLEEEARLDAATEAATQTRAP